MSVITVGDGRGFVIAPKHNRFGKRFVLSAAHCLPWLPPAHPATYTEELTYGPLLGPLGKEPSVLAECAFVDPVADLAVLRSPDNQELSEEADAYEALLEPMAPLEVADVGGREVLGQLLSLKGSWFSCTLQHRGGPFWIKDAKQPIQSGMSGSPILAANGAAVGVISVSGSRDYHGPNPRLIYHLPGWLLAELGVDPGSIRKDQAKARAEQRKKLLPVKLR